MSRTIDDALRIAQRKIRPIRFHQTVARRGYENGGAPITTGEPPSVPERPETLAMQMNQLARGKRASVFVARGARPVNIPEGMDVVYTREGSIYFNPDFISREEVIQSAGGGKLNELLGYVQSKPEALEQSLEQGELPSLVVSRDENGIEQDAAAVSPDRVDEQAEIFADRAMGGSTISQEDLFSNVVRDRMADGGVPDEESQEEFLKEQLEGSAPQYDPEAGILTGKRAGLMAAGFAPGSGIASAVGKFPTAEGGFEPSVREDIKEGHYGSAALKALGAAGDVAYAAPFVGPAVGAAMKAPLAAKLVMAAAPIAKAAHEIAPVAKATEEAAPVLEAAVEAAPEVKGFKTSKGSTYEITPEGQTIRNKAARPDVGHEGQEGIQPKSNRTIYMTPEQMENLSLIQTQSPHDIGLIYDDTTGHVALKYNSGPDAGKIEKRTVSKFSTKPEIGLHPIEDWGGRKVHFGNQIVELFHPEKIQEAAVEAAPALTKTQSQEAMKAAWEAGQGDTSKYKTWNHQWNVEEGPKFRAQQPQEAESALIGHNNPPPNVEPVLNPLGFASRGWEASHQFLPESATWSEMQKILTDQKQGAVKPEEMKWADFRFDPDQIVTREEVAGKFKNAFPQVSRFNYGYPNPFTEKIEELEAAKEGAWQETQEARARMLQVYNDLLAKAQAQSHGRLPENIPFDESLQEWAGNHRGSYQLIDDLLEPRGDYRQKAYENTHPSLHRFMDEYVAASNKYDTALNKYHDAVAEAKSGAGEYAPAQYGDLTMTGGKNYRTSALTLPHEDQLQGIHPELQEKYQQESDQLRNNIDDLQSHYDAMMHDFKQDQFQFIHDMKQKRLEQFYNDPEIMESWEKSRKDGIAPGVDTPLEESNRRLNDLMWKIVNKEAENPAKMADALGLSKEWHEQQFYPHDMVQVGQDLRDLRTKASDLQGKYEYDSRKMWLEDSPLFSTLDFEHPSHLPRAKNPLLHLRFKDRVYVDPETGQELKVLSKEEQQSDLAKHGNKQGFVDPFVERTRKEKETEIDQLMADRDRERRELSKQTEQKHKDLDAKYQHLTFPIEREFNKSKQGFSDIEKYNESYRQLEDLIGPEKQQIRNEHNAAYDALEVQYAAKIKQANKELSQIPDRPYLATKTLPPYMSDERAYHELGVKAALQEALEGGYNRIFIPGAANQAQRYTTQLRQAVDNISWKNASGVKKLEEMKNDYARKMYGNGTTWEELSPEAQNDVLELIENDKGAYGEGTREITAKLKGSKKTRFFVVSPIKEDGKVKNIVMDSDINQAIGQPLSAVLGNDIAKKVMKEETGNLPMQHYVMGSEGYRSLYEEKLPSRYKGILNHYFGKDAGKVYTGEMPDAEGNMVYGTWIDITPEMIEKYNQRKNKAGFFFYGYKRGGSVAQKAASSLDKFVYNMRGNRRIRDALSISRKLTEG